MIRKNKPHCYPLILMILLFTFIAGGIIRADEPGITTAEIEEKVQFLMEKGKIPGLCLVIIRGEEIPYVKGFGYANLEEKLPVTADTLFELASCSKAFTGLAIMQLAEAGQIHLQDPVSKYLPWFSVELADQKPEITLRHLLHHTSGIPTNSIARIPQSNDIDALEQTIKAIVGSKLNRLPGKQYEYATINYDILGLIIREVSGKSFKEYMEYYVFKPLGLSPHTQVGAPRDNPLMATGYKIGFFKPREYAAPVFRGNYPAGYIVSNGSDIARWLRIQLGLVKTDLSDLIPKTHIPDMSVDPDRSEFSSYAAGWIVYQFKNKVMYHSGLNPNFTGFIGFDPGKQLGIAVLANSNSTFTSFIGKNVMNLLSGPPKSFL